MFFLSDYTTDSVLSVQTINLCWIVQMIGEKKDPSSVRSLVFCFSREQAWEYVASALQSSARKIIDRVLKRLDPVLKDTTLPVRDDKIPPVLVENSTLAVWLSQILGYYGSNLEAASIFRNQIRKKEWEEKQHAPWGGRIEEERVFLLYRDEAWFIGSKEQARVVKKDLAKRSVFMLPEADEEFNPLPEKIPNQPRPVSLSGDVAKVLGRAYFHYVYTRLQEPEVTN